jgi:chaperonin GroEL
MTFYDLSKALESEIGSIVSFIKNELSTAIEGDYEMLKQIAIVSSNDEEIGNMIYDITKAIGMYGDIEVKETKDTKTKYEITKGLRVAKGYYHAAFLTDHTKKVFTAHEAYVLIVNDTIHSFDMLEASFNYASSQNVPLLVFMNDIDHAVVDKLINLRMQRPDFKFMLIENDGFGDRRIEIMNDIAAMTGATIMDKDNQEAVLGVVEDVLIDETTTAMKLNPETKDEELAQIAIDEANYNLDNANELGLSDNEVLYYKRRLATLTGGIGLIKVGGQTDVEIKETKDRIDDAVQAVKAAMKNGVCVGGGYTWAHCIRLLLSNNKEGDVGTKVLASTIVATSIFSILETLVTNAERKDLVFGTLDDNLIHNAVDKKMAFDLIADEYQSVDSYKIYDPTLVLIDALTNAFAVSKSILSVSASIFNKM